MPVVVGLCVVPVIAQACGFTTLTVWMLLEGGPYEVIGALCAACAGVVFGYVLLARSGQEKAWQQRRQAFWLVALALVCMVIAGEELSWGQHLANFVAPEWAREHNFQRETNFHNLRYFQDALGGNSVQNLLMFSTLVYLAIVPSICWLMPQKTSWIRRIGLPIPPPDIARGCVVLCIGFVLMSIVYEDREPFLRMKATEIFETSTEALLCLFAFGLATTVPVAASRQRRAALVAALCATIVPLGVASLARMPELSAEAVGEELGRSYAVLGEAYSDVQPQQGESFYRQALVHWPMNHRARFQLAALYASMGDLTRAHEQWQTLLEHQPEHADALFARGQAWEAEANWDRAVADYTRALEIGPERGEVYLARARALLHLGEDDRAAEDFERFSPHVPEAEVAQYMAVGTVRMQQGRRRDAVAVYRLAYELAPEDPKVALCLGYALEQTGQLADASSVYEHAIHIEPEFLAAHLGMARILVNNDETDQALEHLLVILDADPENPAALELQARISER